MSGIRRFLISATCLLFFATTAVAGEREVLESAIRAKVAEFLERQKETHGPDAIAELKEAKAEIGDDGTSHFWFEQVHLGVPVLFGGAVVHTIKRNGPFGNVKVFRGLTGVPTTPSLTREQAIAIAANKLGIRWTTTAEERLVIVPRSTIDGNLPKQNVLAWDFLIAPEEGTSRVRSHRFIINAVTGEILQAEDATIHASASAVHGSIPRLLPYYAPTTGYPDWIGVRTVCSTQKCKSFGYTYDKLYFEDPCFGLGLAVTPQYLAAGRVFCAAGTTTKEGFVPAYRGGNFVCDRDNFLSTCAPFTWSVWDGDYTKIGDGIPGSTNVQTVVADAYVSMRLTFEYLYRTLGRQGLDGLNGPRVRVETRSPDSSGPGAYWDKTFNRVVVGLGDATTFHWATPDVIAHEVGHGLDDYGPKLLVSGSCPEATKLKEAMADMFSMLASRTIDDYGRAWQVVEQPFKVNWSGMTFTPTVADRYLQNPPAHTGYPACYDSTIACMDPHKGSSPAGHMFYLLVYGGTSACNGNVLAPSPSLDVARLWSVAFFKYMSAPIPLTYADMKNAFVFAALEMDGGNPGVVSARVQAAFAAINM